MKRIVLFYLSASILLLAGSSAPAQGTAFTYQGSLRENGSPASGIYDLRFTIYDALTGGSAVSSAVTNVATVVSNGLFAVTLDMGPGVFTGAERWLDIGVRTNGSSDPYTPLEPRQLITATPYAIFSAASGSISNGLIQDPIFLGTTGNTPLELFAGSQRALRLEPNTNGAPNVIGGSPVNQVDAGVIAATIGGGGAANYFGGAYSNRVAADFSTIGGGGANMIQPNASSAVIAGGFGNSIAFNGFGSAIVGGFNNVIQTNASSSFIGGGSLNTIERDVGGATIVGGFYNTNGSVGAGIASGFNNTIGANASSSFIGGGYLNTVQSDAGLSAIGGGQENTIEPNAGLSVIGGGLLNRIHQGADQSVIAGGNAGKIYNGSRESFIAGGFANQILTNASGSFIGAGFGNSIGNNSSVGTIAGGQDNSISNNAQHATIGGGFKNTAAFHNATVGGGYQNFASGNFNIANGDSATVAGGYQNAAAGNNAFVGGGFNNYARGDNTAIAGGWLHTNLTGFGFIGGGQQHLLEPFARFSVVSGGDNNTIQSNSTHAVISGGQFNSIGTNAIYATIPGGVSNLAAGAYSFAAGRRAKAMHRGAFVWADSQDPNFVSSASNQFLIRASGGVGIGVTNPAAALHVAGAVRASAFEGADAPLMFNTTGNQPLEFKVNGMRALRIEFGGDSVADGNTSPDGAPNIIGGAPNNFVPAGVVGVTIAGGGATNYFGTASNTAAADFGAIGGGYGNAIGSNSVNSVIAGGRRNQIGIEAFTATVGGGDGNVIEDGAWSATIAGGGRNRIQINSQGAAISGGGNNLVGANTDYAVIAGGGSNTNLGYASSIGGGLRNQNLGGLYGIIGGGVDNVNETNSFYSVISGGRLNRIETQSFASGILSGNGNLIGRDAQSSVIGGGKQNQINQFAMYASLLGGSNNLAHGSLSSVGGGLGNRALGVGSTVPGGIDNTAWGDYSLAAGRRATANDPGSFVWADSTDLPFASTSSNQFLIRAEFTGINRSTPITANEVFGVRAPVTNDYGGMYMETAGVGLPFYGYAMAGGGYAWTYLDGLDGNKWKLSYGLTVTPSGNVGIGTTAPTTLLQVGGATCDGTTWNNASDRNLKENFKPVDSQAVLAKVAALPITEWNYQAQDKSARHIGPMAQDFQAAFHVGQDDKHIATVDADGVALAAIQGLNQKVEEQAQAIKSKDTRIAELERRLSALEQLIQSKIQKGE